MTQEVVKELRNQKGWSQSELAALSGLSVKTIQRIENGQGAPSLDTAKALASIFDRQFSDFLPAAPPKEKSVQRHSDSAEPNEITSSQESADVYANMLHKAKHYWRPAVTTVFVATLFGFLTKLYLDMETLSGDVSALASARPSEVVLGLLGGVGDVLICSSEQRCEVGSFADYYGDQALSQAFHSIDENEKNNGYVTLLELIMLRNTARIITAWEESAGLNSDVSSSQALSYYVQCYGDSRSKLILVDEKIAKMQECVYVVLSEAEWEVVPKMGQALMDLASRMENTGPYYKQFTLPVTAQITDY
jgi:transcriptional regulator with XRE-family HTH domain